MCHSSLFSFGKIEGGPELLISNLLSYIGSDGTLILPSFTYSYCKNQVYDLVYSKSRVGVLADIALSRGDSIRSLDPIFSMVAIGSQAEDLMKLESPNCFGPKSIYQKINDIGCTFLLLGVDFSSLSFFMHLEKKLNVPYRYDKAFYGQTVTPNGSFNSKAIHYVRDMQLAAKTNRSRIAKDILNHSMCNQKYLAYSNHISVPSSVVEEVVIKRYKSNKTYLINKS
jgi:aminoglycoside 3-N-acetyltransferase